MAETDNIRPESCSGDPSKVVVDAAKGKACMAHTLSANALNSGFEKWCCRAYKAESLIDW